MEAMLVAYANISVSSKTAGALRDARDCALHFIASRVDVVVPAIERGNESYGSDDHLRGSEQFARKWPCVTITPATLRRFPFFPIDPVCCSSSFLVTFRL